MAIDDLAGYDNLEVKLGGIRMAISGMSRHHGPDGATSEQVAETSGSDIRWCIERFGVDRCRFESVFPVERASYFHAVLWNALKRIAANASASDKSALFHDAAVAVCRLA